MPTYDTARTNYELQMVMEPGHKIRPSQEGNACLAPSEAFLNRLGK